MKCLAMLAVFVSSIALANAQLLVSPGEPKVTGKKAVIKLTMKNSFTEKIESARATVFILDDHGKMIGQATKWVIGGSTNSPGLAAGATNLFYFVVQSPKTFATTNLTAKVTFNRLVLDGGKLVDATKNVEIK